MKPLPLFITCPKGLEGLLFEELTTLGATKPQETVSGVYCLASMEAMYKICLWSRLANRVYLFLKSGDVDSAKACYDLARSIPWLDLLRPGSTIAVDFIGTSDFMRNTMFGAQLIKDAIVDTYKDAQKERPSVNPNQPDCGVHARFHHGELSLYYDLSGHSLHQRGYRKDAGAAPLKENVAAALLLRAGWAKMMPAPLIDPFCGSGTLLIEAMMMASKKAPGLDRLDYGFLHWQGHDDSLWSSRQANALEQHELGMEGELPPMFGYDSDAKVVAIAKRNIRAAGFTDQIKVEERDIRHFRIPDGLSSGLIITNPPYGERLGISESLMPVYRDLGSAIKNSQLRAAVLTSDPNLARATHLRSRKNYSFLNGTIPCKLYLFD